TSLSQQITIHRLVQFVIKDEMPEELFATTADVVIGMCDCAFPLGDDRNWDNELLRRKRRYQNQVMMPLSTIQKIGSTKFGELLQRVGRFVRSEGEYQEAEKLFKKALDIFNF